MKKNVLKVGTRGSQLSLIQTQDALDKLAALFPELAFEVVPFTTVGDRDLQTDLRDSPGDFFTRELDDAVREGRVDFAVHSAKDLPDPVPEGLDWFWLPWREDPRDAWVFPPGKPPFERRCPKGGGLPSAFPTPASEEQTSASEYGGTPFQKGAPVIGISSARREAYCRKRFPNAVMKPVRGAIPDRLAQLDAGDFDAILMAGAALNRLGLAGRVTEWVPLDALPVPPGQGYLAVTFRQGAPLMTRLRSYFVKAVRFVGGGVGSADYCTLGGADDLRHADVCLYDVLTDDALLALLPPHAERVFVGKRCGGHSMAQAEITALIANYARQGKRVVRLKGGDPGLFGRLAEEVAELDRLALPYRVRAGVSALTVATTGTGMLLTRRGVSRGFTAMTPRMARGEVLKFESSEVLKLCGDAGVSPLPEGTLEEVRKFERSKVLKLCGGAGISPLSEETLELQNFRTLELPPSSVPLPLVLFMSVGVGPEMARRLLAEGWDGGAPVAIVFNAGADDEEVVRMTLGGLADEMRNEELGIRNREAPGLVIIGPPAAESYRRDTGALGGARVLLTCSEALLRKAALRVADFGGAPLLRPMIKLVPRETKIDFENYDWIVLTSPTAAQMFMEAVLGGGGDLRRLPKIMTCGPGSAAVLRRFGIVPDLTPPMDYSAEGLAEIIRNEELVIRNQRVLRLRSEKAGTLLADVLRQGGALVDDVVLYKNENVQYTSLPPFDAVFFASASAVESFAAQFGGGALEGKTIVALGGPTADALRAIGRPPHVTPPLATVDGAVEALARHTVM